MLEAAAALAEHAERGRVVPGLAIDATRELFVYSWLSYTGQVQAW